MRSKHRFAAKSTWRRSASEKTSNAITGNHKGSAAESLGKQEKHSHHQHTHRFEGACVFDMSLRRPAFWHPSARGGISFILGVVMLLVVTPKSPSLKRNHDCVYCHDLEYTAPIRKVTNMSSIELILSTGQWFGVEHLELWTIKQTNTFAWAKSISI